VDQTESDPTGLPGHIRLQIGRMKCNALLALAAVTLTSGAFAATEAIPTVGTAREMLHARIKAQGQGRLDLVSLQSEAGAQPAPWDNDGEGRFLITYEAVVEFNQPCVWDTQFEGQPVTFRTFPAGTLDAVPNRVLAVSTKGERYQLRGQIALKGSREAWTPTSFLWSDPPQKLNPSPLAAYPADTLANDLLKVRFYLPDRSAGYYRGTRFDWSGLISRIEYAGHSFFSEFKTEHDPLNHDDVCGTAEEFGITAPAGYAEAAPGEGFLKVGIGVLEKPDSGPYSFGRRHRIVQEAPWEVTKGPNRVEFRQILANTNGWGYRYAKTLELDPASPTLTIRRRLTNTGTRAIQTDHYGHNFLQIDGVPAGPDYVLTFPFEPKLGTDSQTHGCMAVSGRSLIFIKEVPADKSVWLRIEGHRSAADNRITIENRKTKAAMEIATDQPLSRLAFYCHGGVLSPEPFVEVNLPAGATKEWATVYSFRRGPGQRP
jgi:hypothetical protein